MAVRFSEAQVCDATGAKKTRSGSRASFGAVCTDSRAVVNDCLFVALKGERFDAHDFLAQAVDAGAAGVVVESRTRCTRSVVWGALTEIVSPSPSAR
jgi:UDP-N-acetylmuramoyl-tripeptide--D-alanyl-D-alanine ligase